MNSSCPFKSKQDYTEQLLDFKDWKLEPFMVINECECAQTFLKATTPDWSEWQGYC